MLQCRKDTKGFVDLSLCQFGLFLATAILLSVVFSLLFSNDWQRTAELESMTSDFSNLLEDLNSIFFEHASHYELPKKDYEFTVKLSTEYIVISAEGSWGHNLLVAKRFISEIWIRNGSQNWTTGAELHEYLNNTCGHQGTPDDAIPPDQFAQFLSEQNSTIIFLALHPFEVQIRRPVTLEKVIIYYEPDKRYDLLLLYQST